METQFDPATARAYEGLFTQGAGYLHVRGSLEEHLNDAPQNLDYSRRPANVTAEKFWHDRSLPFATQVTQEWLYRSKCLKQADVLMLMMLFPYEFTEIEIQTAWDYYLPYTTHDSSLSAGVHAIVACRLNKGEEAWDFWQKSSLNDQDFSHGGAAEGIHMAGAGINWQMVVFGFAGVTTAMNSEIFHLEPRLPKAWSRLAFLIVWKGCSLWIDIHMQRISIQNLSEKSIQVKIYQREYFIRAEERVEITTVLKGEEHGNG